MTDMPGDTDGLEPDLLEGLIPENAFNDLLHAFGNEMIMDSIRWFGEEVATSLTITSMGVAAESGEQLDVVKKIMRGSKDLEDAAVMEELAVELIDVWIYWCQLITLLDIDVEQTYARKRAENEERFG
jgi:NTP pyrophosphatase (non-canonical NTP hydrolase)